MGLLDHFRPPLGRARHWEGFHSLWAGAMVRQLNLSALPPNYVAEPTVKLGVEIEADVADTFEIKVYRDEGGLRLAGAIELVSPRNKDRPGSRAAFIRKCATYLHERIGLIIVDIVTSRPGNFHADLLELLHTGATAPGGAADLIGRQALYAAAYRCRPGKSGALIEAWPHALHLGSALPTLPLYLEESLAVPVELEETYQSACEGLKI
jgi:hypothetical protein